MNGSESTPEYVSGGREEVVALTENEREALRLWLYEHNGSIGPDPVTAGAGGLPGLWTAVERILNERAAAVRTGQADGALKTPQGEVAPGIKEPRRACTPPPADLTEEGRRLASQRDDLIAQGVDPADLGVPIYPTSTGQADGEAGVLDEKDAAALHLRDHLTDGVWHDGCGYCQRRRAHGGTGLAEPALRCDTCSDTGRVEWMVEADPSCSQEPDDEGKVPCPDCAAAPNPGGNGEGGEHG